MKYTFLVPVIGLIAGVLLADNCSSTLIIGGIAIGLALVIWLILSHFSKDPLKGRKISKWHNAWIFLLFFGVGWIDFDVLGKPYIEYDIDRKPVTFLAEVEDVKYLVDGDRFTLKIRNITDSLGHKVNSGNLKIILKTTSFPASKGDILSFSASPKKFNNKNGYGDKMRHQGILYSAFVKDESITKVGVMESWRRFFHELRSQLTIKIEKSALNRETSEFLISLLLGDKSLLSSETRATLTSAGLAHVLALSGLHLAILYSFFTILLFPLALIGKHKTIKIISLIFIWSYVFFTGCAPSMIRAAIMLTLVVAAYIFERKNASVNALLAALLIIILIDPLSLWNIGLQLSFICVAGILIFTNKFNPIDQHLHPRTYKSINLVLVTLVTTFCSWTLVAYYFGSVPLLFLPANILLLPFLPIFMAAGIIYVFFLAYGIDLFFLAKCLDFFNSMFIGSADLLSLHSQSAIDIKISLPTLLLWILGIIVIAVSLYGINKYRKISTLAGIGLLISAIGVNSIYKPANQNSLKFSNSYSSIHANLLGADGIKDYEFPRNNISSLTTEKFHINSIDVKIHEDSIEKLIHVGHPAPYLIVGPNADIQQISKLISEGNYNKVILHSGLNKNKIAELLSLVDEALWAKIYSLRSNGSLEFDL